MWMMRDCKIIADKHVATHHKPLFFVVRREYNVVGKI